MENCLTGYIEKIVFRNEETGYTVLTLCYEEEEVTCVGIFSFIHEGECIQVEGNYIFHTAYGEQFKVDKYEIKEPEDTMAIQRYLGSGAIKGIGQTMSERIVKKFGKDTFRIIEEEPERLVEIKGISEKKAREVAEQFEEKREFRAIMLFLQKYGIQTKLAVKIYKQYGSRMYEVIQKNPYKLADDIRGIGFKLADDIANKVGLGLDSSYRIKAGILYVLSQAGNIGHVYLPKTLLLQQTIELLNIELEKIEYYFMDMILEKKVIAKELGEETIVYYTPYYYMELNVAKMLCDLNIKYDISTSALETYIARIQEEDKLELDQMQKIAIMEATRNGVLIITGGPGTGKTTTINTIIKLFQYEGMEILLAAPTGRAAKRMAETTKHEAQTIHRLLELQGGNAESDSNMNFERNESNPLEADVLIIDEMSMVDINLIHVLLKAIVVGTRVIFVGDINQLPSVGPGNVLKDIIQSHCFHVVMLTKIFRQASESDIIVNAHKINAGETLQLDNKSKDFFLLQREDSFNITRALISLINEKLPNYVNTTPLDIQVLTPMRKGDLGVENLNMILQKYVNPPHINKMEKEWGNITFREGDKVMQIKNNYQLVWEIKSSYGITIETGSGVFNGDTGIIRAINLFSELVIVEYEESKLVEYPFTGLDELELAYAITIHKSQGSEYPAIILPILTGPRMLFNRNLLYTAVTRAKKCVTIVGSKYMVQHMINNVSEQKRYSTLDNRILEMISK